MGAENPITSKELEYAFGVGGEDVRKTVNKLRQQGVPIGSSASGYFYAIDLVETRRVVESLKRRIKGINAAIEGLEKYIKEQEAI